jgi:integrase/recombinase XerC
MNEKTLLLQEWLSSKNFLISNTNNSFDKNSDVLISTERHFGEELLNHFIAFIDVKPKTILTYKISIKQFFKWVKLNKIVNPKRDDIIKYKSDLKILGLKPSTIANYIIAIRQFFKWTDNEKLYSNIAKNIKTPKIDKRHKKDYLTVGQVNELLNSLNKNDLRGLRDYALLLLMLTGGLRTIEVSRADFSDLAILAGNEILYIQGKGYDEKTEFIKITNQVGNAIREYLKMAGSMVKDTSPLFINLSNNAKGKRLTSQSISRIIKNRLRQAGYNSQKLTAHSLRHTAITLALLYGATIQEAQSLARHMDINSTQIYAHNLDRTNSRIEQLITNAIFQCNTDSV